MKRTDEFGREKFGQPTFEGAVPIFVRQTATTAAGAVVWGIANIGQTKQIIIPKLWFRLAFDGTGAATLMRYEVIKADTLSAFSGGAITPTEYDSIYSAPVASLHMLDTGLTTTGIANVTKIDQATWSRITPSATVPGGISDLYTFDFTHLYRGGILLRSGELLAIRNGPTNASVVGDMVMGGAELVEY